MNGYTCRCSLYRKSEVSKEPILKCCTSNCFRKTSSQELSFGDERVFEYNDTGDAWNKLEQYSNYNITEPYIGRVGHFLF